ncbi:PIG-L family deacetylase [Streptomyces abikoensis]|uniref:PIG-L family deacetylase n=1 Tax=Streptomyces abikoensis TaxID=97398 RepID=UPI00371C5D37
MRLFKRRKQDSGVPARGVCHSDWAPHMQICAHTDDDLYFMTPDLLQSVRAGIPVVSVYLTTGEADGINLSFSDPARKTAEPDYPGYTAARQHGIRAAYSALVTGSRRGEWTRDTLQVREGVTAEINTFGEGRVTLIFLNLRTCVAMPDQKVLHLWARNIEELATLRPAGSPIPEESDGRTLTRDGVIDTLVDLLQRYEPAVVRVMNPDPDRVSYEPESGSISYCDNTDHTAAAFFALAALRRYERTNPARKPAVESYMGYCNKLRPDNLSAASAAEKFHYLAVYGGEDGHECQKAPGECGDRPLGNRAYNRAYGQSTTHRWQPSTTWLQRRADGRLTAFTVLGGRPAMWTQDRAGSWSGPKSLGTWPADNDGRCLPRLDVIRDGQGRLHVIAMRSRIGAGPEEQQRDVMHLVESAEDGSFGTWTNVGNPYGRAATAAARRRGLGMPVATVTGSGRIKVAFRNFGGGLSARTTTDEGWGPWEDLHGGLLDDPAGICLKRGTVEFYATTKDGMLRWYQEEPKGAFERDYGTLLPRPSGSVSLLEQTDGRVLMLSRQPGTGWLLAHRQREASGSWDPQPHLLDNAPGYGPVAHAVLPSGDLVLVQRRDNGTLSISRQPLDGSTLNSEWTPLGGGPFVRAPSVAVDGAGRVVVAVLDAQARLRTLTIDADAPFTARLANRWRQH